MKNASTGANIIVCWQTYRCGAVSWRLRLRLEFLMPKWLSPVVLLFALLASVQLCAAQDDSASTAIFDPTTESTSAEPVPDPVQVSTFAREPSEWQILGSQWKRSAPDILHDQKQIWLFPVSMVRGHHLMPALAMLGATALLATTDAHNAAYIRDTPALGGFNKAFSGFNTATATEAFASAFYLAAILRRNAYDQKTFLLAGEAVIDSEILTTVMKDIDRREAPVTYLPNGNFRDSWFKVPTNDGGYLGGLGSMPSGHEIAVMAVATIFAERYPHPAWHRWLAYGLAAAVGVSRVTLQSHFTSDTFAGGVLGFAIARYVVLARHPAN